MRHAIWQQRAFGASLALSVQAIFLLLALLSPSHETKRSSPPLESILFIPPLAVPAPSTIDARGPRQRHTLVPMPVSVPPPIAVPPSAAPSLAPPSGLAGFGRGLFGCAPEHYADLTPDERAHCPKPGEGLAVNQAPDLMHAPSHVKDEAHWRQEWARVHEPALLPCGGFADLLCVVSKIMDGSLSDYGDPSKWPSYAVEQFSDQDLQKIEETYDAWNRAHPVAPPHDTTGTETDSAKTVGIHP
jgi:hypothetical protein